MFETFNSQDKVLLLLEDVSEDDDSLILQNVRISNKEKEEIREGVSKQNGVILIYHPSGLSYYKMTKILTQSLLLLLLC